jgi:hypothetical protein
MNLDLAVLCPDGAWKQVLRVILQDRFQSLGIREIRCRFVLDPLHDSSGQAVDLLKSFQSHAAYGLVVRDLHGSGREAGGAETLENEIHGELIKSGWPTDRCAAIVADPEIEAWLRFDSNHLESLLKERARRNKSEIELWRKLANQLSEQLGGVNSAGKPLAPKEVFAGLTRDHYGIPTSNELLAFLAGRESLKRCVVPSFRRFTDLMREWFPPQPV